MEKKIKILVKSFLMSTLGGFLGAWGGADHTSKMWRRLCIPFMLASLAYNRTENLWIVMILSMIGSLSMGYGIPSSTDSGSSLGKFWYTRFKGNILLSNIFTRFTISVMFACNLLIIPIFYSNWNIYLPACLILSIIYSTFSWMNLGQFTFNNKKLNWSEFISYFTLSLISSIIILSI